MGSLGQQWQLVTMTTLLSIRRLALAGLFLIVDRTTLIYETLWNFLFSTTFHSWLLEIMNDMMMAMSPYTINSQSKTYIGENLRYVPRSVFLDLEPSVIDEVSVSIFPIWNYLLIYSGKSQIPLIYSKIYLIYFTKPKILLNFEHPVFPP